MAGVKTKCITCGCEFISMTTSDIQKRCSRECYYKSIRGVKLSKEHVEKIKKSLTGFKHTENTKLKMSKNRTGIKRPNTSGSKSCKWKGGVSTKNELERKSIEYKQWRISVFVKDNYSCVCCGQLGLKLHPHHLFNFSSHVDLRFNVHNGVTMCEQCHKDFHKEFGVYNNNPTQFIEFLKRWMAMLPVID